MTPETCLWKPHLLALSCNWRPIRQFIYESFKLCIKILTQFLLCCVGSSFCNQMGMFCHYTSNIGCFLRKAKTKFHSTEMYKVKVCTIALLNFSIRLSHMGPNFCALYICSHINKCTQFYLQLTLFSVVRCF